jgi:hypothetical protein
MIYQGNHLQRSSGNKLILIVFIIAILKKSELKMCYKLPLKANEYVLFQRTSLISDTRSNLRKKLSRIGMGKTYEEVVREQSKRNHAEIEKEYYKKVRESFERIKSHISSHTKSLLDIGSGIAGLDIYLWHLLKKNNPQIYLLDKTRSEKKIWYSFSSNGAFYNSLHLAKQNLILNLIPHNRIKLIKAPDNGIIKNLKNIDLVISTISWGYHYPVDLYIDSVISIMAKNGILILDVRKNTGGLETLASKFNHISIINEDKNSFTVKCSKKNMARQ